jgi:hypothetical protein
METGMTLRSLLACALLAMVVIVAGCTSNSYRSVQAGVVVAGKMRVTLGSGWKQAPSAEVPEKLSTSKVFSRAGLERDRLILVTAVENGAALFRDPGTAGLPVFRADMSEKEIGDFVAVSLQAVLWDGAAMLAASNARPHGFTGIPGFRFELEADVLGAADHRGMAGGFVDDDKLYVTIYLAESPRYYEKHRQAADDAIESTVLTIKTIRMN